jgi:uncharacterized protein YbaR (Trm112 family)
MVMEEKAVCAKMAYDDLIKRLRCPADRSELDHVPDRVLVCRTCGRAYPIREGVPVMLLDEKVQAEGQRLAEEATAAGLLGARATEEKRDDPEGES